MHLTFLNVNDAFVGLVQGVHSKEIPTVARNSRVGQVLQVVEPMLITYLRPKERVLFNTARDMNPFFALFQSLWMLAGRNDVAPLEYYASKVGDIASDDGLTFNGAYGYRWRKAKCRGSQTISFNNSTGRQEAYTHPGTDSFDQLPILIDHLKRKPESRRVVLDMWNVEDDLLKIDTSKDVCCNLNVMFSIREESVNIGFPTTPRGQKVLDMTVTNRSNDLIWGTLGSDSMDFSILQEYIANCLSVRVGEYHQFTNNLHVYTESNSGFHPEKWLAKDANKLQYPTLSYEVWNHVRLVSVQEKFDAEVKTFINYDWGNTSTYEWEEPFLQCVAEPMMRAFYFHKNRDYKAATYWCNSITATDWRLVCNKWIDRRKALWEAKVNSKSK